MTDKQRRESTIRHIAHATLQSMLKFQNCLTLLNTALSTDDDTYINADMVEDIVGGLNYGEPITESAIDALIANAEPDEV
jgi:hypothetical protein